MQNATATISYNKAVFSNSGDWAWEDAGKFSQHVKGMSIKFTKNNLAGTKRVTIIATPKKGDPITFSCTEPLSVIIRKVIAEGAKQVDVLGTLLNYNLQVDKENAERYFIFQPQGDLLEGLVVTDEVVSNFEDAAF